MENVEPHQSATHLSAGSMSRFYVNLAEIIADLKSGKVFGTCDLSHERNRIPKAGTAAQPHGKLKGDGPDTLNEIHEWGWAQLPSEDIVRGLVRERFLKFTDPAAATTFTRFAWRSIAKQAKNIATRITLETIQNGRNCQRKKAAVPNTNVRITVITRPSARGWMGKGKSSPSVISG